MNFRYLIKILIFVLGLTNVINKTPNKDLLKFYRNIKLRAHFGSTENNSNEPRFKSNSNWLPDKLPSCVETFITAINHDIKSSKTKKLPRDNLTKSEREALLNLQKRNDNITQKLTKEALW